MKLISLCVLVGSVFAGALSAQVQAPQALTESPVPIHTADDDLGVRYGTWAAGSTYKVSFHDGMTFVPYLGGDYPHNQPWSWQTTSVKAGETELLGKTAEGVTAPIHVQSDYRYEYRFGAVTEAYDVLLEGLEQTFVVHQRPAAGDLVVTGAITSKMHAPNREAAHRTLTFGDASGQAILNYGKAFAFDENGDRTQVHTTYQDHSITLTVPGDWLRNATFPVTVDPLVSRVFLAVSFAGASVTQADIGTDDWSVTKNVMVVTHRRASQVDDDVYVTLCNEDFTNANLVFSDITSIWDSDTARCAFIGGTNKWAVIFRRYLPLAGIRTSKLRCHLHPTGSPLLLTNLAYLTTPASHNDWRCDVGGVEAYHNGSDAMIVFQREANTNTAGHWANTGTSGVYGVLLDTTTSNGTFGTPFPIWSNASQDAERPSINQVAEGGSTFSPGFSWICALQVHDNVAGDDWDVRARRISNTGSVSGTWTSDFDAPGTHHQLGPIVEGANGRYAVAFSTLDLVSTPNKTGGNRGKQVQVERFDWPHGGPHSGDKPPVAIISDASPIFEPSGLAYDTSTSSHFAVGFRTVATTPASAWCARVGYNGELTEGPLLLYSVAGHTCSGPACVYINDRGTFSYSYGVNNGNNYPLFGQAFEYVSPPSSGTSGFGCSSAVISWQGSQQIGSELGEVRVNSAPVGGIHFLLVATAAIDIPLAIPVVLPGCRLLAPTSGPNYLGIMPIALGASPSWTLALPEFLSPGTLYFQDWILNGQALESSSRLDLPIVK